MMLEHGAFRLLQLPSSITLTAGCRISVRVGLPVFPGNKPIISWSPSVLFLSQSSGVTGLPRVQYAACDHPLASRTHLPPQSDDSELWISLDSFLWNMNFPKETFEKQTSYKINLNRRPTCIWETETQTLHGSRNNAISMLLCILNLYFLFKVAFAGPFVDDSFINVKPTRRFIFF